MDKRLKDYYDGLFSPEEESEVQKWLALHGKDEFVSDSLRELFDGEEKCSGEQTLMYKRIVPEKKSIWRSSLMAANALYVVAKYVSEPMRVNCGYADADITAIYDDATATVAQIPDFVVRWEYENRSSVTQQLSTGFSSTATRTSSFSNTYGVSVSVTSSFSVDVPVASSNLTISMNSSYSHTWGKSETQSDTRNYNFPISVPPYCRIIAEAIVARYQLNVGYTTYLRSVNTGKEIRLEGRWRGIDCAEIKAKCTEYELDSNNITKIKTFNGVPHEAVVL